MRCEWLILCEKVELLKDRGFSIFGVVGRLAVDALSLSTEPMVAAFRPVGEPHESFEIQLEFIGPDGSAFMGGRPFGTPFLDLVCGTRL